MDNTISGDTGSAWKKQQALELQSTSHVQIAQQPVTGGAVCVWDAFGEFWCEKEARKNNSLKQPHHGYVEAVAKHGQPMVFEGFCGCGADVQ